MSKLPLIINQTFKGIDYSKSALHKAEYDSCKFIDCNFEDTYISNISFLDCEFNECNLSMAKAKQTTLKDVSFINCKMIGFPFNTCNDFLMSLNFKGCNLNFATFDALNLKNTIFNNCNLNEVDFTKTDLTESAFINCNLNKTIFENSVLDKVDFTSSHSFTINPEINSLKFAKFSINNVIGLLNKYNIEIE